MKYVVVLKDQVKNNPQV